MLRDRDLTNWEGGSYSREIQVVCSYPVQKLQKNIELTNFISIINFLWILKIYVFAKYWFEDEKSIYLSQK